MCVHPIHRHTDTQIQTDRQMRIECKFSLLMSLFLGYLHPFRTHTLTHTYTHINTNRQTDR